MCYLVAGRTEGLRFAIDYAQIEQHFLAFIFGFLQVDLGQFQCKVVGCAGRNGGEFHALATHDVSFAYDFVNKVEIAQILKGIGVGKTQVGFLVLQRVRQHQELHKLMCRLDLSQFGAFVPGGWQDTIGAEVALMRSGEVVAGVQAVDSLLDFLRFVDGLVHPIPDAATNAGVRVFDDVPVFVQIADGVAHGMGVFTNKHRFVQSAGILVHPGHAGVHLGVEVRESAAAVGAGGTCALVVYGAVVERFGHVVAIAEVLAVASLVAQAPHQHAGTIAVTLYHALDAVGESRNPRCAVRDALIGVILKVCLVDTVQAVVIKHGIEACGIGIVGSTYGVDVILLHQHDVAQHLVGCHGATVERRGVVAVRTLE